MTDTPEQLLQRLLQTPHETYPLAVIEEMMARREEMVPAWLAVLDDVLARPEIYSGVDEVGSRHWLVGFFSTFLLAQFSVKEALVPLLKILRQPGDFAFDLFGDSVHEDIPAIVASLCGGRTELICEVIEAATANEYVRSSCLQSLLCLVSEGELSLEWLKGYFRELMEHRLEREHSVVWDNVTMYSGDHRFAELLPLIRRAFEEELCAPMFCSLESIEYEANLEADMPLRHRERHKFIVDTIATTKNWPCFSPPRPRPKSLYVPQATPPQKPAAGRNDPCPCGSGKKFKKCCGAMG